MRFVPIRIALVCTSLALAAGCGENNPTDACTPKTDDQLCQEASAACGELSVTDNCGAARTIASCGACAGTGESCVANKCGCTPKTDAELCKSADAQCGQLKVTDNCGQQRTIANCGTCEGVENVCDAATNKCSCTPDTDAQVCAKTNDAKCGSLAAFDNCGALRTIESCGTCAGTGEGCENNQCLCHPKSDLQLCADANAVCGTINVNDNCGAARTVTCGTCRSFESCESNQCVCHPVTDAQLCAATNNAVCGSITATDNCGASRTVTSCGTCTGTGEGCENNHCVCHPKTDAQLCADANANCGSLTATDNCGATRTVTCGTCAGSGQTCTANRCSCTPMTDAQLCTATNAANCGTITATDNCGAVRTVTSCGTCTGTGQSCQQNHCACTPKTDTQLCADASAVCGALSVNDNCGVARTVASCGACTGTGQVCTANHTCVCTPKTDAQLCADAGATCGSLSVTDNCGAARTVANCGTCTGTDACTANHCTCTPKTDAQLCAAASADCGSLTATDCGVSRTVASCGTCAGTGVTCNANHCGCIAKTDAQLCADAGATCGSITATDNCGASRTVANCGACPLPSTCNTTRKVCQVPGSPLNDSCAAAEPLVFDGTGLATANGDTSKATESGASKNCSTNTGYDVVYSMTLTQAQGVDFTLSSSFINAVLYVRAACTDTTTELRCTAAATNALTNALSLPRLEAGTYYVWVDSTSSSYYGTFQLKAQLKAPAAAPINDTCAAPLPLTLLGGYASVTGTTDGARNDYRGSCDSSYPFIGADVVYSFTLTSDSSVLARVTRGASAPTSFYPGVYLRANCTSASPADERSCATSGTSALATATTTSALGAGTYYVIVDGQAGSGPFTLELEASPVVTNTVCAAAMPLLFDGNGVAAISGDNAFGASNQSSSTTGCTSSGKELVYTFTTTQALNVEAIVTPLSATAQPGVIIRGTCTDTATQKTCATASAAGKAVRATAANLAAGTYFVLVDSYGSTATLQGPFNLEIRLYPTTPVPNAVCAGAQPLFFDYAGRATASATTALSANVQTGGGTCTSQAGPELVYTFTLAAPMAVSAKVSRADTDPLFNPTLYIRATCTDAATHQGCNAGATSSQNFSWFDLPNLAAGTYFVIVDSASATNMGWFNLEIVQKPVKTNDTCTTPTALTFDGNGVASVDDDTTFAANDLAVSSTSGCGSFSSANDLVYSFTTLGEKDVVVQVTPKAGQITRHTVYLRNNCTSNTYPTSEVACAYAAANGDTVKTISRRLPAGTYYVIVDGYSTGATAASYNVGPFNLKVTATDPAAAPANDNCTAAATLSFDAVTGHALVTGSTFAAKDDINGTGSCSQTYSGGDVVYTFTLAADAWVQATVKRDATDTYFKPLLYIRTNSCTSTASADQKTCNADTSGVVTLSTTLLTAGTYWVVVDGANNSSPTDLNPQGTFGNFTLDLWQRPVNSCTAATPLTFTNNVATVTDDTSLQVTSALSTSTTGCGSGSGKEIVYSFTTTATKDIDVIVTPLAGLLHKKAVYIRTTCTDNATQVACGTTGFNGGVVEVKGRLVANTYYLVVDGASTSDNGAYTMTVTLVDPPTVTVPTNDTCTNATPLTFNASGYAAVSGSTLGANDDYQGVSCSTANAGDVVYSFTLAQISPVTIKVTRDQATPTYVPVFYVRSTCGSTAAADEKMCVAGSTSSTNPYVITKTLKNMAAGTYYVVVDSATGTSGSFGLEVQTYPAVTNDTCASPDAPTPIQLDGSGFALISGDLSVLDPVNTGDGSCNSASGYDAVFSLTLPTAKTVRVQMEPGLNATTKPNVYMRRVCDDKASEVACAYTSSSNTAVEFTVNVVPAGTYFIWVDSYSTSSANNGTYNLRVWTSDPPTAPANAVCTGAIPLAFDTTTGKSVSVYGETTYVTSAQSATCDPGTGGELVYSFTTTAAQKVVATATRTVGSTYNPLVYIRSACGSTAANSELTCAKGSSGTATATINNLAAGTYYVWVDGVGTSGVFKLDVQLSAPATGPANESCAFATPITFTGGTASVAGTTTGAVNEAWSNTTSCTTTSSPDVVYSITLAQAQSLTVTVTPANAGATYRPGFMVRKSCGSTAVTDELFCAGAATAAPYVATGNFGYLAAGTYYIWIDAYSSSNASGDFTLDLALAAPRTPPANDTCTTATALTFTDGVATVAGTIADAMNDTIGYGCSPSMLTPDVYYSFTVPSNVSARVEVTPVDTTGGFKPWVDIRKNCASAASADEMACANGSSSPYKATATASLTTGTTYFIVVDSYGATFGTGATAGQFNMTVTLLFPPPNDTCTNPVVVTAGTTYNGDTSYANADYFGSVSQTWPAACSSSSYFPKNRDLVYQFTATTTGTVTATLTPTGWDPLIWYSTGPCGTASACQGIKDAGSSGAAETLTMNVTAGTVYYIYVSNYSATISSTYAGPFTLVVQ